MRIQSTITFKYHYLINNTDIITEKKVNIHITDAALLHFNQLIEKEAPGMGLRMSVEKVPTKVLPEIVISFCPKDAIQLEDIALPYSHFILYIDKKSESYLEDAHIDYQIKDLVEQLSITAPNLKNKKPQEMDTLADKINYVLNTEVNPSLAAHGGMVSLVEVTDKNEVVLRFGGGCHGCGMVDVTLRQGIEKALKEKLPDITAVIDITDHTQGENPYY